VSEAELDESAFNVYFTQSVNHDYVMPGGIPAKGSWNLEAAFIDRIEASTESIDICISKIGDDGADVVTALIAAHARGVNVRVIVDWNKYEYPYPDPEQMPVPETTKYPQIQRLEDAGIPVQHDWTHTQSYDLHDKFAVFDYGGVTDADDWAWNGSLHWFEEGPGTGSSVYVEVQNTELAAAFHEEFELMWDDDGEGAGDEGLYHSQKYDHPPSQTHFVVNGKLWEFYPGPQREHPERGHIWPMREMVKHMDMTYADLIAPPVDDPFGYGAEYPCQTNHEFLFQIATFEWCRSTNNSDYFSPGDLYTVLENKRVEEDALVSGAMRVCGRPRKGHRRCVSCPPVEWSHAFDAALYPHQEYGIVDGFHLYSAPSVFYGSPRWTEGSQVWNDELTLCIWDQRIVNQFVQEFVARMVEIVESLPELRPAISGYDTDPEDVFDQIYDYDAMPAVIIAGDNFINEDGRLSVSIGGQSCLIESVKDEEIHARFPGGLAPDYYDFTVTNSNGWNSTLAGVVRIHPLEGAASPTK
jgi:phosphatidylserine/phosphatidylglycerophosphate/cardiolipin synthase-like enzyme